MARDWKKNLMGSTTMPLGTDGTFHFSLGGHHHHHADGSCCDHDHGVAEIENACGHDHAPGEACSIKK